MTDEDDEEVRPRRRARQAESLIGNILEMISTYASPATFYAPFLAVMIFFLDNPSTPEAERSTLTAFVVGTVICLVLYGLGTAIGTGAKFSANPTRMFVSFIAMLTPALVPISMVVRDSFVAGGLDWELALYGFLFQIVFGVMFYNMYTAIRRVREVTGEQ